MGVSLIAQEVQSANYYKARGRRLWAVVKTWSRNISYADTSPGIDVKLEGLESIQETETIF